MDRLFIKIKFDRNDISYRTPNSEETSPVRPGDRFVFKDEFDDEL